MLMRKMRTLAEVLAALTRASVRRIQGAQSLFEIAPGYSHRASGAYFDDTASTDDWQKEVYERARDIMRTQRLTSIYDVGCGSAYKLINILGEYDTTGFDVPKTIDVVKARYPDRKWLSPCFNDISLPKADLVICADVIEHVDDPDSLLRFVVNCAKKWIIISTPDRDAFYRRGKLNKHYYGPPANPTHIREWTMPELRRYVERFAKVELHEITNRVQATQMIVARVYRSAEGCLLKSLHFAEPEVNLDVVRVEVSKKSVMGATAAGRPHRGCSS
jgi:SAM-dependent methyltransferase